MTDDTVLSALLGAIPAIALPWLAGWLAVRSVPTIRNANRFLQLSLGFLGGQMLVLMGMALGNTLLGHWSVWITLCVLLAAAIAGFYLAAGPGRATVPTGSASLDETGRWPRLLTGLLVLLCAGHLTFTAIEILHRPVYPWDAWLNWMYRAKAWYYADAWLAFDTPDMWLRGVRENAYAVAGRHYPPLVPVTAVWMALWTGAWTETLINLPTLALGFALAFGAYGLAREAELPVWASLLAAYLLISLPLLGAHLSLAGMADTWMAAYAGLGFGCLFVGLYGRRGAWMIIGLVLIGASRFIKLEGGPWLMTALLMTAVGLRPRATLLVLGVAVATALAGFAAGLQHVNLPVLGTVGVLEGRIYVPLVGSYALADWQLVDDYRDNFLRGGSWHLLWIGVVAVPLLLLRSRYWREAALVSVFLAALCLALLGIFQFTEQGAWAEDWSAINRLPLHFSPLLTLLVAFAANRLAEEHQGTSIIAATAIVAIGAATVLGLLLWSSEQQSRGETGETVVLNGDALNAVLGQVTIDNSGAISYGAFQDGITVLTSGEVRLQAKDASLITVVTSGSNKEAMTLFWRNDSSPGELQTLFIDQRGIVAIDAAAEPTWSGTIIELGITAFDDGGSLKLDQISLAANNATAQRRKAINDWLIPNAWTQRSVNWVDAGSVETRISLPLLLAGSLAVLVICSMAPGAVGQGCLHASALAALLFWVILDTRWLYSRLHMAEQTIDEYSLVRAEALKLGDDQSVRDAAGGFQQMLGETDPREANSMSLPPIVALATEVEADQFKRLRARYHLLPQAGINLPQNDRLDRSVSDYLLVLKNTFREPGSADRVSATWTQGLPDWQIAEDTPERLILRRARP